MHPSQSFNFNAILIFIQSKLCGKLKRYTNYKSNIFNGEKVFSALASSIKRNLFEIKTHSLINDKSCTFLPHIKLEKLINCLSCGMWKKVNNRGTSGYNMSFWKLSLKNFCSLNYPRFLMFCLLCFIFWTKIFLYQFDLESTSRRVKFTKKLIWFPSTFILYLAQRTLCS